LLPFLSKVLEKVVAKHLTARLEKNNLLIRFQSGFRRCHSTETAVVTIANDILYSNDSGQVSAFFFLDLSAAFDIIDHKSCYLVLKLIWASQVLLYHGLVLISI